MKNFVIMLAFFLIGTTALTAQKYFTREANIAFFSDTPLEKIEAQNKAATSVIDTETGKLEFAVLIKAFQFEKALMQEHFNENYMESSTYPKSTFKGQLVDATAVDFNKDGSYPVKVKGELTIHGVTKEVETQGVIDIKNGALMATARFEVQVADYGIEIPAVVRENIAKTVRIDLTANYLPLKR